MDLKVQSNFLDRLEWDYVIDKTIHSKNWAFFGTSASDDNFTFWGINLKSDSFFSDFFLKKIESVYNKKFKLSRVYANGQTYGLPGSLHTDNGEDVDNTFLYYVGPEWNLEWGGHTVFHDIKTNMVHNQLPVPNTGILFDSDILHVGMEPTRHCKALRVSIAFKLKEIGDL